jgi:hypothetical protein
MEDIEELKKYIKENPNKETQIQMRLIDNKNNKVAYKYLTIKELILLEAGTNLEWHDLTKEKRKT